MGYEFDSSSDILFCVFLGINLEGEVGPEGFEPFGLADNGYFPTGLCFGAKKTEECDPSLFPDL